MLNSTQLLTCLTGAVTLIPCGLCLIVWGYVLWMALFMRSATAADTDVQSISARYALVFHEDLHAAVADAMRQMVRGLTGGLALCTLWYFFAAEGEQAQPIRLLGCLLLLEGVMWLAGRLVSLLTALSARTKTAAAGKLAAALRTGRSAHALVGLLTVFVRWLLTL